MVTRALFSHKVAPPYCGSGGAASEPGSLSRQVVGNKNGQANTFSSTVTARFVHIRNKRYFAENANWSQIQMTFANFVANSVAESIGYPTLTVKASILYQGTYYPALWGGAARKTVAGGAKIVSDTIATLVGTAGTEYEECLLLVYPLLYKTQTVNFTVGEVVTGGTSGATGTIVSQTDSGTTGSLVLSNETGTFVDSETLTGNLGGAAVVDLTTTQSLITSIGSQSAFNEGTKTSNNSALDYTTTSPVVYPVYTATVSGGNITAVTKVSGGSGWTSAPNLIAYEAQANGTLAIKTIGFGSPSAGEIASGTVTSGTPPAGVAAWVNPTVVMSGGSGFGNSTAIPCCALITGIPSVATKSLLIIGDSIARGYTSTDTTGDLEHNYGVYERAIATRFPVANMSISGGKASYYKDYVTIYPLLFDLFMGSTTHALNTLGTNDIQAGDSKATLEGNINTINTYVRTFGTRVANATIITRTTSTDGFTTTLNQTPVAGFATGGIADQYNADLLSNVVTSQWNVVQLRPVYQDSVSTDKWRVDLSSVPTSDGTHPNLFGIGYGQINSTFKSYFNVLS